MLGLDAFASGPDKGVQNYLRPPVSVAGHSPDTLWTFSGHSVSQSISQSDRQNISQSVSQSVQLVSPVQSVGQSSPVSQSGQSVSPVPKDLRRPL